ncbi:hypothetical protein [Mycolicibacterium sp. OfavD-34-C]|uniref:hypothetical protein n=1 Tax=Mycolicibacterium sp. OfavD-34-C TaxID=2917746 RepID=UPI001EF54AA9|nr:hypothetical protein [Mycolicibacterium sp. OfavD-34-C]MCG7579602.1 hypothetical protein [Mycolicibacterium sp. OfavD-34-C]
MSFREWSGTKVRLILLAAVVPVMIIWVVISYATESADKPTGDCLSAENAVRHWASVLSDVQKSMAGDVDTTLSVDTAQAAAAIRGEADVIGDSALRTTVLELAAQLDRVSRGDPSSPPNGFPDKDYMGGYQGTLAAVHDIKAACPEIGDDPVPSGPERTG